jgi:putative protein kinase ArgK-like GTPase of G3E family
MIYELISKHFSWVKVKAGENFNIAVDPTSPFSGGAILGDRLRMAATLLRRSKWITG